MSTEGAGPNPRIKLLIDLGPLVLFFAAFRFFDLFVATGVLMVTITIALAASWKIEGKLPIMPLVTAVFVLIFGGLTLWLQNDTFIKIKPTIIYLLFATILGVGLLRGRSMLQPLLGSAMQLEDEGWHKLTARWAFFFVFQAVLNELVWRNSSESQWVTWKAFGAIPLTFVFMLTQMGLLQKYQIPEEEEEESEGQSEG
ncbi:MAG: septation protein A [bacterium]|nr:septation protein A [bacterium]